MRDLIAELVAGGWSHRQIARAARLSRRTVDEIANGSRHRVTYATLRALVSLADRARRR